MGTTSLNVSWAAPASNGDALLGYAVYACDVSSGVCVSSHAGAGETSTRVSPLAPARNWTVLVSAFNGIGSSGNASSGGTVTTHAPPMAGYVPHRAAPLQRGDALELARVLAPAPAPLGW